VEMAAIIAMIAKTMANRSQRELISDRSTI
jgi:hypothetical protein